MIDDQPKLMSFRFFSYSNLVTHMLTRTELLGMGISSANNAYLSPFCTNKILRLFIAFVSYLTAHNRPNGQD